MKSRKEKHIGSPDMSEEFSPTHESRRTVYTSCMCNCGSDHQCIIKAHVINGRIVAVEPDDRYNNNIGREDDVLSEEDLIRVRLQRRPCTKGLAFYRHIYDPKRVLYPLKRIPGTRRGEGKYLRISWKEALDTVAEKMKEIRRKYGPYSIIVPNPNTGSGDIRFLSLWGAGVAGCGASSFDAARLMAHIVTGASGWDYARYASSSASDMLANSKLIVLWGFDPTMGSCGPGNQFAWFIKLARERGKPVIIIDPRYTIAAEVLADQWIPIKPGTDTAMFMAMAHVLFNENLCDLHFISQYVEPVGFERWKNYILGADDGVEKTPEWAEKKCAVPAETIRELTRLVATERPAWLWCHWGVSRKSRGEHTVKAFIALQAMLGYWGIPGAGPPIHPGPARDIPTQVSWGPPGDYDIPQMFRTHYWAQAILLLDKVRNGELSEDEYRRRVGWRAEPSLLKDFNPKMIFVAGNTPYGSNQLITATDSPNDQIEALGRMEFIVSKHSIITPTTQYADIILPTRDWMWEEKNVVKSGGFGGFECINYCPGVVEPPAEVKSWVWIFVKLIEKLGIDPKQYFKYYTNDENWDRDWERYQKDRYQNIVDYYKRRNIDVPCWEEFAQGKFINCDEIEEKPFTGFDEQMKNGKPFETESGKIELYSHYIANETNKRRGIHFDPMGRVYKNLPGDWSDLTPLATYQTIFRGMDDPLVKNYPLMLLSPHPRYRVHTLFWEEPLLRDHVYKHRVWISPTDAKVRGIKDDDLVHVYNDRGRVVMHAYVTSRMMPGIVAIHHGGWYLPNSSGIDFGASPSTLLGGDFKNSTVPAKTTTLVQVEPYRGE